MVGTRTPVFKGPARAYFEWVIPAACCLVLLAQLFLSLQHLSQEADESTHLYAGYRTLRCGDFGFGAEHPPLAKTVAALPLLAEHPSVDCAPVVRYEPQASLTWLYAQDWQKLLFLARAAASLFAVGLLALAWIAARHMFGFATAVIATLLLVFEPNFLAHGALVGNDIAVSFTLLFAVYMFYLWVRKRSLMRLVLAGAAAGMSLLAKHSGVVIVPLLCLLAVLDACFEPEHQPRWRAALRNLIAVVLICVIATGVVWSGYGFRFAARPNGEPLPVLYSGGSGAGMLMAMRQHHWLPEAYLEGLQRARMLARVQMEPMFLFGRVHSRTRWYFFPANIIIRYTVAALVLIGLGLFGAKYLYQQRRRELLFAIVPAGAYLLSCMQARAPSGIRHTLPMLSFLLITVAAGSVQLARRKRWVKYALPCLMLLHAVSSVRAYPNYLSYANELWGGPENAYRYLPWVDLGAGLKQVKTYIDQHPDEPCWLGTTFMMEARYYGVRCRQFGDWYSTPIPPQVRGMVILSSAFLSSVNQLPGGVLEQFARLKPTDHIAGSALLVYRGDFDMSLAASVTESSAARVAITETGDLLGALRHGRRAVEIAPEDVEAQFQYCRALVANDVPDEAALQCAVALALTDYTPAQARPSNIVEARKAALGITEAMLARHALDKGQLGAAMSHGKRAVELAPKSGRAHLEYCQALAANREYGLAGAECNNAHVFMTSLARPGSLTPPDFRWNRIDQINAMLYASGIHGE